MDYHAVSPPDYEAGGDSNPGEMCQQDPKQFTFTTTAAPSSRRLGATEAASTSRRLDATRAASSSGRPEATRDPLNMSIRESVTSNKNQEEQEFYTMVLRSICVQFGKDPAGLGDFPLNKTVLELVRK